MQTLDISKIIPDTNQPRKYFNVEKMAALKSSIKKHGIMNPVIVQKEGDSYMLVDGERRFRAATELKLKEIPILIVNSEDALTRLIEQFHLQEQHEGWSPTEKASAIISISEVSGKSLKEIGEMLSISERTIRYYVAFSQLRYKEKFVENNLSLEAAEGIRTVKGIAKRAKEGVLNESFILSDEKKLEKVLIEQISDGKIKNRRDYAHIGDSFKKDPKLIDSFMDGNEEVSDMYVKSDAKTVSALRNCLISAGYVVQKGQEYLKRPTIKMTNSEVSRIKECLRVCKELITFTE